MILPSSPLAVKTGRAPDRWIPAKWTWLRWACQRVFGPPRLAYLEVQFIEASETVASVVAANSLGQPQAQSNGVAVWILPGKQRQSSEATMRMVMADRMEAQAGVMGTNVCYRAALYTHVEKEMVDLSTRLIVTSASQTIFVAAARAQLPYGKAMFLLNARQPESASNRLEILITADECDAKGYPIHRKAAGR